MVHNVLHYFRRSCLVQVGHYLQMTKYLVWFLMQTMARGTKGIQLETMLTQCHAFGDRVYAYASLPLDPGIFSSPRPAGARVLGDIRQREPFSKSESYVDDYIERNE